MATAAFRALSPGDTLFLLSGTYTGGIVIDSGGIGADARKTLRGLAYPAGLPVFQGTRAGTATYDNQSTSSAAVVFQGSADPAAAIRWVEVGDLTVRNHGAAVLFKSPDPRSANSSTLPRFPARECFSDIVLSGIDGTEVYLGIMLVQARRVTVRECDFVQFGFRAFNLWSYTSEILFDRCTADGLGDRTVDNWVMNDLPTGFYATDVSAAGEIHTVTYRDCIARNILTNAGNTSATGYWNGDGFTSEEGSVDFTYLRCAAYNCEDGGFDDKASNTVYTGCIAMGNKRGFRHHASAPMRPIMATYRDCLSAYNRKRGGSSSEDGFWLANDEPVAGEPVVLIERCTSFNNRGHALRIDRGGPLRVIVRDSLLGHDGTVPALAITNAFAGTTIELEATVATFRPGEGVDPQLIAPDAAWRGGPPDAFDSVTHGVAKGFHSENVAASLGYAGWRTRRFPANDAAGQPSSPLADPEGDGRINLLEYALGTDPLVADASATAVTTSPAEWAFRYTRSALRPDLAYRVEISRDLLLWRSDEAPPAERISAGALETWQVRLPLSAGAPVFFRLRVDLAAP